MTRQHVIFGSGPLGRAVARQVAASVGADVLYHCMSADCGHWPQALPPLMGGFIAAARAAGARAVYGDNLYSYGPVSGSIHEGLPTTHTGRNVRVRRELAEMLLEADRTGMLRVAIGRASDFFGPEVLQSTLGNRVFPALLGGQSVGPLPAGAALGRRSLPVRGGFRHPHHPKPGSATKDVDLVSGAEHGPASRHREGR